MDNPTPTPSSNNKTQDKKKKNNWLVYSGMALEMFSIIGIFTFLGFHLDKRFSISPVLLIGLMLLGFSISFYRIYKQL